MSFPSVLELTHNPKHSLQMGSRMALLSHPLMHTMLVQHVYPGDAQQNRQHNPSFHSTSGKIDNAIYHNISPLVAIYRYLLSIMHYMHKSHQWRP